MEVEFAKSILLFISLI